MYLLDVALHNLACLAKKGMLLIQEQFRLFLRERQYRYNLHAILLKQCNHWRITGVGFH